MEGSQGGGAGGGDGAQDRAIVFANDVMHWQDKVAYRLAPEEKAAQLELVTSLGHRREELVASAAALFGYLLSGRMGSARRRIQAGILCGAWSYSTAYLALDNDPGYRYLTKVSACDTRLGAYVRGLLSDNRVQQPPDLADRITPLTVVSVLTLAHFVTLFVSFSVKKVEATVSKDAGNFSAAVPLLSMYSVTLKLRGQAYSLIARYDLLNQQTHLMYVTFPNFGLDYSIIARNENLIFSNTTGAAKLWWKLFFCQRRNVLRQAKKI
ncbi:hypothetical protein DIPPA_11558 [Diplonema papillatum]|nr:hypothetical protein DIPPA_11558 [Diplonema papillatum]